MASSVPPSNPFDGFDSYSTVASPAMTSPTQGAGTAYNVNVQPTQTQQQQQQQQQHYAVPPEYQRPVASVALPQFADQMLPMPGSGFRPPQPQPQPQQPVVQQQQPAVVQQQQQPVAQQQQLVPAAPSAMSPWALPPAAPVAPNNAAFPQQQQMVQMDPFAVQPQQPQYQQQQQQFLSPQYQIPPPQQQQQQPTAQQRLHNEAQGFFNDQQQAAMMSSASLLDETDQEGLGLIDVELDDDENNTSNTNNHNNNSDNLERRKADGEFFGKHRNHHSTTLPHDKNANIAPPPPITPARQHAEYLSQQTPRTSSGTLTSPLPKPSLVLHSGYVLSRISFRTVLLRKWKQTFWIQYGPTQLLFFRSSADYEDWLNNPYHTQKARDFLVKLRVDFVSDLKKSQVMGYQVTQIRRKPYGKNVMLHFKLERWMDYGPTIAAAFAAREEEMVHSPTNHRNRNDGGGEGNEYMNSTNDVASLRKIILGCMRNARDAALVARRDGGGDDEVSEDMYRGRYSSDRDAYNTPTNDNAARGTMNDRSGSKNMGYHQAFSAESTPRRRMDVGNDSPAPESVKTEESAEAEVATNGVVDLLG